VASGKGERMAERTRSRFWKGTVAAMLAVAAAIAAVGAVAAPATAKIYSDNPFKVAGTVTDADEAIPGTGTGSFRIDDLDGFDGAPFDDAIDEDGGVRIETTSNTRFKKQDADGRYATSSFTAVLAVGERVLVAGRWTEVNGSKTLVANYIWNPPPTNVTSQPANPQPSLPADSYPRRIFGAVGIISDTGTRLYNDGPWSQEFGFVIGDLTHTGHEHTERVAAHDNGQLRLHYTPTTRFWVPGNPDATREDVIRLAEPVRVHGRYHWDGFDWRFLVSNVFADPSPPDGGPLRAEALLSQTDEGTEDALDGSVSGTRYEGRTTGPFDGAPTGGSIALDLTWWQDEGGWKFSGSYTAVKDGSANSLSGPVSGTVVEINGVRRISGSMLVETATGAWSGWSGEGSLEGTVGFSDFGDLPPTAIDADFDWELRSP
jgi:hypothetical protein